MGLMASSGGGGYEQVPPGTHRAVCYKIVDGGTLMEGFQGEPERPRHCVFLFWELPDVRMGDDRPMSIFKQYTLSLNENSGLHKDLKSWRGKSFTPKELEGFDLQNVLGVSCDIEVEHNANGNAKVVSIFKPDGGAKKTATVNDQVAFDIDVYCAEFAGNSSPESKAHCDMFEDLPRFICTRIETSLEMQAAIRKGDKADKAEKPATGLAGMAEKKEEPELPEEDFDDDIPF